VGARIDSLLCVRPKQLILSVRAAIYWMNLETGHDRVLAGDPTCQLSGYADGPASDARFGNDLRCLCLETSSPALTPTEDRLLVFDPVNGCFRSVTGTILSCRNS
jgi:hypothetical protein